MPTARRILSGVAIALFMALRIQVGLAANIRPSNTKRIPRPMRKSEYAMDLIGLEPPVSSVFSSNSKQQRQGQAKALRRRCQSLQLVYQGLAAVAADWGAAEAPVVPCGAGGVNLPDELLKKRKKSESGVSRKRVSVPLSPFS